MISKTVKFILSLCMIIGLLSPIPSFALEEEEFSESEDNEVYIIDEDETLRTESSKTFVMSDDSYQKVIYGVPVHFEDDSGEYQSIDNSLVASTDSEDEFVTAASDMKIRFNRKMHESELIGIELDRYRITWGFADMINEADAVIESSQSHSDDIVQNALENISGSIRYENVRDHVTLKYGFDSLGVKENIILDEYMEDSSFTFTYNTENLLLAVNEEGEIEARDSETDEIIFVMPKPYMYDASEEASYDVEYTLSGEDGNYDITVTADNEWLSESEREYPVVIDPIIETQTKRSAIDSTFITSWQGTENYSEKHELLVGTETSEYGYCRTLIKFTLPELKRGDMVTGAELVVAGYRNDFYSSSTPDMQVNAHMITSSWDMGEVTWNTKPTHESSPVLDYDFFRKDDKAGSANWKCFDITRAAKQWYEGTANNGIMLKARTESTDYAQYAVKSYIWPERYNEQEDAYPRIVITYRNTKGLESYYDYTSASASNGDEIHINTYNGNPVVVRSDLSAPGGKNPAVLGHVYNGYMLDTNAGDIWPWTGVGWRLNVQQTVRTTNLGEKYPYVYTDGDGTEHYFMKTDSDEIRDEDGLGLTLKENFPGYTIKSSSGSYFTFNALGNLTEMTDEYGNDITVAYKSDNRTIKTISDDTGYVITLSSESGTDGNIYLKSAKDNKGKTVTFTYSDNRLIRITGSDTRKDAAYSYASNGNLTKIASSDGSYIKISYT